MSVAPKVLLAIALLAILTTLATLFLRRRQNPKPDIYLSLRNQALQTKRDKIGLPSTAHPTEPWAVVMDWALPRGTATVVAISDGSASVYLSSGGGFIGGGQSSESVRQAARNAVAAAVEMQAAMKPATTFPLPNRGEVAFYALTDAGVFSANVSEADLSAHRSPFLRLGDALQAIITEYRSIDQKR